MKHLSIVLMAALISSFAFANYSADYQRSNVVESSAPTSDQPSNKSKKDATQDYIDTARTGQSSTLRTYQSKTQTCRDADGVWHKANDEAYESCVKAAKAVNSNKGSY